MSSRIDFFVFFLKHSNQSIDFCLYSFIVHVRKRNTLMNGSIISADNEIAKGKISFNPSLNAIDDNKLVRPYFLIRPQTVLMLPNEIGKLIERDFYERNNMNLFSEI